MTKQEPIDKQVEIILQTFESEPILCAFSSQMKERIARTMAEQLWDDLAKEVRRQLAELPDVQ
jgi:hypothetical protein